MNDQPPTPGGDPDQPNNDLPRAPRDQAAREPKQKKKTGRGETGYGHTGNTDVPRPSGAPKPHQIF
jgi:hypothetical protein